MSKNVVAILKTQPKTQSQFEQRLQKLEQSWGNPTDSNNPVGFQALLNADEKNEMLLAGEQLLNEYQLRAEFVPTEYGGRFDSVEQLIQIMRSVYRHDPCLGLGYGASSLIAGVNVWVAGDFEQCSKVAELFLSNGILACAYNELAHGSDLNKACCHAAQSEKILTLNGGKQIIANIQQADNILLYVRTSDAEGSRSHSLVLIDKANITRDSLKYLPRFNSLGMRGVQLGGIEFHNCEIADNCIVGIKGQGLETAMKAFQITRTAIPSMFIGVLDTSLRIVINYAQQRKLYNTTVIQLPLTQTTLVDIFADLLLADSLCTVVARALHFLPKQSNVYAAVVKSLVPKILIQAMNRLSSVLGANFYLIDGEQAMFQKLLRDLKPVSFGHASKTTCQMSILPQLSKLARRAWFKDKPATEELFDLSAKLPELSFSSLAITNNGKDPLLASILTISDALSSNTDPEYLKIYQLVQSLILIWKKLQQQVLDLTPQEFTLMANQQSYELTDRYALLVAASASLNLWWHNPELQKVDYIFMVIQKIHHQLDHSNTNLTNNTQLLFDELMQRYHGSRSFDINATKLSAWNT